MPPFSASLLLFVAIVRSDRCHYSDELAYQINEYFTPRLHTRDDPYGYEIISGDSENLLRSTYEPGNPTKVIVHGYLSSCDSEVFHVIKDAYLNIDEYNIICFDWSPLVSDTYTEAVDNLQLSGVALARFLDWLIYKTGTEPSGDLHLIGHSLGAHVVGIAELATCHGNVGRITALDPAVPSISFNFGSSLDRSSANFVEIIFTSVLASGHPLGDGNYFINGGSKQPECGNDDSTPFFTNIICNHARAYQLFAEVISYPDTYSKYSCRDEISARSNIRCENLSLLSFEDSFKQEGVFYVKTNP